MISAAVSLRHDFVPLTILTGRSTQLSSLPVQKGVCYGSHCSDCLGQLLQSESKTFSRMNLKSSMRRRMTVRAEATEGPVEEVARFDETIPCDKCAGRGWLTCDFCKGEKVNVRNPERTNKFYRRCPTCRAAGVVMCDSCRVFKCLTFVDTTD